MLDYRCAILCLTSEVSSLKKQSQAPLPMPVIPATQEAESRRIMVRSRPWGNSSRDPISTKPFTKKRAGGMDQITGPELKSQY
jgi:hypothetical protein